MSDETPILDLGPRLLAKKHRDCDHPRAVVCFTSASLTCDECGAELDPWWYLRKLANDEETLRGNIERYAALTEQAKAKYEAEVARMNTQLQRLNAEVNTLIHEKNRLWNMAVPGDGRPLGAVTVRQRKRALRGVNAGEVLLSTGKPTSDT